MVGASLKNKANSGAFSGSLFMGDWAGAEVPGLGIETDSAIRQAADSLVGAPVTVEHSGTLEAVESIDNAAGDLSARAVHAFLSGSADPKKRPVGTVVMSEGTKVLIHIKPEAARVSRLIEEGVLDLSLTHLEEGSSVKSLELALTTTPARSGASILQTYKAEPVQPFVHKLVMSSAEAQPQMETTPEVVEPQEQAAVSPEPLLAAFEALSPEHKEAIQAKVLALQTQVEEAQAATKVAEEEAERQKKTIQDYTEDATRDKELFKMKIDALASELQQNHPAAAAMIQSTHGIAAAHPAAQLVADRMVRACSEILSGSPAVLGRKRSRTEAPVVQQSAPAVAKTPAPVPERATTNERLRNFLTSMDTL